MPLMVDIIVPEGEGLPVIQLSGLDRLAHLQLSGVKCDLELLADESGNPFIAVDLPDRGLTIAQSSPIPCELFFQLEASMDKGSRKPLLKQIIGNEEIDLQKALCWSLFDFTGSLSRARKLANQRRFMEAVREAQSAVIQNDDREGFRVVLARLLTANGKARDAKGLLEEELSLFENSYRAMTELAEIEFKDIHNDNAQELLEKALEIYPNNLKALLLLSDLLLKQGLEDNVVQYLARAWRLCGALCPDHVLKVLKRRLKEGLLEEVSQVVKKVERAERVEKDTQPEPSPKPTTFSCSEITNEEVIRLVARDVFRDGTVSAKEKKLFQKICSRFALDNERVSAIVAEEKAAMAEHGPIGGEFSSAELFRKILERVYADGKLSRHEGEIVMALARSLGLSKDICLEIKKEVLSS